MQPPPLIITSSPRVICITNMSINEKKSQKPKILSILSIKKVVVDAKHLAVNDFIDNFTNIMSSIFF